MMCACSFLEDGRQFVCDGCRKYERREQLMQRLNDIALGAQGQPKLFADAIWQEFQIDLERKSIILEKYDLKEYYNFAWITGQIVDKTWNMLAELEMNGIQ